MVSSAYCITLFPKIKEIFSCPYNFFCQQSQFFQGQGRRLDKGRRGFRPEVPYRTQEPGDAAEEQYPAACRPQQHKAPHLSVRNPQQKGQTSQGQGDAVEEIQRRGQPGQQPPEGTHQIVENPGAQAKEDGLEKQDQLPGDDHAHSQPKMRLRNPPRSRPLSS